MEWRCTFRRVRKYWFLWIGLMFFSVLVRGQCYPPTEPPGQYCFTAPMLCLQNLCYAPSPWTFDLFEEPDEWCMGSNPSLHPHYYMFQASATGGQIVISVTDCKGDTCGLQAVIINRCLMAAQSWTPENVVACDSLGCEKDFMLLQSTHLIPGNFYWLMIDNNNADVFCSYEIVYTTGIVLPQMTEELVSASTPDAAVCPGQTQWTATAEPVLSEAQGYMWTGFPWPPGYHFSTFADMAGSEWIDIPVDAPPGVYQICVVGFTACDTSDIPACFDLEILDIDGVSEPVELCPEEFGTDITWEGHNITQPGTYVSSYLSQEGCPYDSTKVFTSLPESNVEGFIDTLLCGEFLEYEGVEYFNTGLFTLHYPGANSYGCDSVATLFVDLTYIEATASFYCLNSAFVLTSEIVLAVPSMNGIAYAWYHNDTLISTSPSFTSPYPGIYELYVRYSACTFPALTNPVVINLDELRPPPPNIEIYEGTICASETVTYSVTPDLDTLMRYYEWSINPPVPFILSDTLDSSILVNWQGYTGGTICVNAVNHCGTGRDTCFNIVVLPAPLAAFQVQSLVCADSIETITFTGIASPDAQYFWNFGNATVISGGTGPGPHQVLWSLPGIHTISLHVTEVTCDTASITQNVNVEQLGQPVVSCHSTINTVTFEWAPVDGALMYEVQVLQGPAGAIMNDTSYIVAGLDAGSTVEIELTISGTGACPSVSVTAECIAQNCPPRMIEIQIPATTLCLGQISTPIPLVALVDGTPESGIWSGPGVDPAGIFDPHHSSAGVGIHTIVFSYTEGTCIYQRSITVTILPTPTATFSADDVICQSNSASVVYTGNASINAFHTWDFGGGIASGTGSGPYLITWNSPGTYTITLIVEDAGCVSEVVSHSIEVQPAIGLPAFSCLPTTSSVTIQWSPVPFATSYDVTHLFGPVGMVSGNQYEVIGLSPGDSIAIQIVISGNTVCPPAVITASCVAQECPTPQISIEPVDDICIDPKTGIVDLMVDITNGQGTGVWLGNGISDNITGTFDPTLAGAGQHLIEFHYTENGCTFIESVVVSVFIPPIAIISNTSFTLTCDNNGQLLLDGAQSSGQGMLFYQWTTINGMILGPTDQATATAGAPGDYFLTVVDLSSQCEDVVSVTLVEDTVVPDAEAGPDEKITCTTPNAILGGNSSSGPSISYAWSSPDGGIITSDPSEAKIIVASAGTYMLTVTDQDNGCTAEDQTVVTADFIQPFAVLMVADILNCDVHSTTITAVVSPPGSYTFDWTTIDGQILSGQSSAIVVVDRAGEYDLVVINTTNGCTDTFITEVIADPEVIDDLNVRIDNPDCTGDQDGEIEILQVVGGTAPFTYTWSHQVTGPRVSSLTPGTYTVTVADANGCMFIETVTLTEPLEISPELDAILQYDFGETVSITLIVKDPDVVAEIAWGGIAPVCPGCFEMTFPATISGSVVVTVTDINGCPESDTLLLTVVKNRNIYIPNIFSPNGDEINDRLTIEGKLLVHIDYFRVFDRWGNLVYEQKDVPAGGFAEWDGTFAGKPLNSGVFVYTTKFLLADGYEEVLIGDVTLIR